MLSFTTTVDIAYNHALSTQLRSETQFVWWAQWNFFFKKIKVSTMQVVISGSQRIAVIKGSQLGGFCP